MRQLKLYPAPKIPKGVKHALSVHHSVLFIHLSFLGNLRNEFKRAMRFNYETQFLINDSHDASWNYETDEEFAKSFVGKRKVEQVVIDFIDTMGTTARNLDKVSKLVASNSLRRKGNKKDLIEDLEIYWNAYKQHMTSLTVFWNVERLLSKELERLLRKAGREDEIQNGLSRFFKPNELNYFGLERIALQRIAKRFTSHNRARKQNAKTAKPELLLAVKEHIKIYGFLFITFNLGRSPSIASVLERLNDLSVNRGEEINLQEFVKDSFEDLPENIRVLGKLAQSFTFWKNERLDTFFLCDKRVNELYKQTAELLKINLPSLFAMTSMEIKESLEKGKLVVDKDVLKQRRKSFCLVLNKGKINFYQTTTTKKYKRLSNDIQLKGRAASKGRARGIARIIMNTKDLRRLKAGEILVTPMTRPEMGMALDRAAAFVTDEGGLLCHAAIIAREMGKPCIIGIQNATKVLKDGDLIEVDANNGVITIL
jgi:phosphoenolpyruvate synthase/pyruvate phosphate dikinase